jgi:microcystin-dependent protein
MSTEPFIGEIKLFGFNFAPRGYATCSGQVLSIAQNTALFSLLGTNFGGNGQTTFGLPNLNGRLAIGMGQSPGTSNYVIGETAGAENCTLTINQMPLHNHAATGITVNQPVGSSNDDAGAANNFISNSTSGMGDFFGTVASADVMGSAKVGGATAMTGGSQPFPILQPYLVINYSIALEGIFPSRN